MSLPSLPTACRTVVVLGYLLALALGGRPGWGTAPLALLLVGIWLAPLAPRSGRRAAALVTAPVTALEPAEPAEAPAT